MILADILIFICVPFVVTTLYFGTKGGYYDSDNYDGDGCAHDVERRAETHMMRKIIPCQKLL